jgi:cation transport ATPase
MALGAAGATVASETADAVVMVDRLDRVADAVTISRRAMAIAHQSVVAGMLLSLAAMVAASFGLLPPIAGAVLQEGIDLAVIVNALRALREGRPPRWAFGWNRMNRPDVGSGASLTSSA